MSADATKDWPERPTHGRAWFQHSDGTEQVDRSPPALADDYVRVNEQGLGDLLRVAARMASNLTYVNEANEPDGHWADLYINDSAYVMAEIASLEPGRLEEDFIRLTASGETERQALRIRNLAAHLNRWLRVLGRDEHPSAQDLSWTISEMVRKELAPSLHAAGDFLAGTRGPEAGPYRDFEAVWGLRTEGGADTPFPRSGLPDKPRDVREHLVSSYYSLLNAITYLKRPSLVGLRENLQSRNHDPSMGLVLAFLQLLLGVQEPLNDLVRRRLDFYYHDVLGMQARPRTPDRAHLVLTPAPGAPPALVPAGTRFSAGKDENNQELVFASEEALVLTDTRVRSIRSIHYEREEAISPESELGYVTRILGATATEAQMRSAERESAPIFGARGGSGTTYSGQRAAVGFAVASPILALAEGTRSLTFEVELGMPLGAPTQTVDEAVADICSLPDGDEDAFHRQFGALFSRQLLSCGPSEVGGGSASWLSRPDQDRVRQAAQRILGGRGDDGARSLGIIEGLLESDPLVLFHDLFRTALRARFTGQAGWEVVEHFYVGPFTGSDDRPSGLRIEMTLGPEVGPVVPYAPDLHGAQFECSMPVVAFRLNSQAIFFPFSLLDQLALEAIAIEVDVQDVSGMALHNNLGQLDSTKPFAPFGPLPSRDSYLVVGNYEAAQKKLTAASIDIEWGELPDDPGGFRQHYFEYGTDVSNSSFKVDVSVLRDAQWQPLQTDRRPVEDLFDTADEAGGVSRHAHLDLRVLEAFKPIPETMSPEEFQSLRHVRQGFFRLSLTPSEATFGHGEYPTLLTQVLSANARKKKPDPIPSAPYTPLINRLTMNYSARTTIRPGAPEQASTGEPREQILHEHPYGVEDLTAPSDEQVLSLVPGVPGSAGPRGQATTREGYLFIGFTGCAPAGPLSLLFHMRHDATRQASVADSQAVWYYLASNRWKPLEPARVLADSTDDFQAPGIVTIDVPEDITDANSVMPKGLYWLALGANKNLLSFAARLLSVSAGAVRVTWIDRGNVRANLPDGLPAGSIRAPVVAVPGIAGVQQVGASFGGRAPETREQLFTRTSERLRHKNRAVSPWDYERLVLERFPDVFKVKVFPNTDTRYPHPMPGRVLVIVVPKLNGKDDDQTLTPNLSGGQILRIRDLLRDVSSQFAHVHVRNATYERVQVRCTVKLAPGSRSGYHLRELNHAIVDFLSPWRDGGYGPRFGWRIRRKDIEARIRELDFVDFVTDFSMLHITQDFRGRYSLADTARSTSILSPLPEPVGTGISAADEVVARYPWSLAIPSRNHFIELIPDATEIDPRVTGVGELEVGSTLILDSRNPHE